MSENLKPVEHIHQSITVNGQDERILSLPKTREDIVTMTMGGKSEFKMELTVDEFESATGHYIVGLEPEYEFDKDFLIEQYKDMLKENDFTLEDNDEHAIAGGHIHFSTEKNVHASVLSYIVERDDSYIVRVRRDAGWGTKRSKDFEGPKSSLPLLLSNAERTIDAYTSTKVQVLNKELTDEEKIRKYDEDGFAILKPNESLDDYFKSQEMNAGIVINAAGKYQAFFSSMYNADLDDIQRKDPDFRQGDHNFNSLHYDTKSYKTLKGAEKFLAQKGFDSKGRNLDTIDVDKFAEAIRTYNSHTGFMDSYYDHEISNFNLPKGFGNIDHVKKDYDEKFGFRYTIDFNYTDEATGKTYSETAHLSGSKEGHDLGRATAKMYEFVKNANEHLYNPESDINFQEDTRTIQEKLDYHKERYLKSKSSFERMSASLEKSDNKESLAKSWAKYLEKDQKLMSLHKSAFADLSLDKEQDNNNSMSM